MNELLKIKEQIYAHLIDQLDQRIANAEKAMQSAAESRDNETKSSVGDKYETGRAMMQIEYAKNEAQLLKAKGLKSTLTFLDIRKNSDKVVQGSIVNTNHGIYFIAIGIGKVKLNNEVYFCISLESPIGKTLKGKSLRDKFSYQTREFEILAIF